MANTLGAGGTSSVYKEEWLTKLQERLDKPVTFKEVCDVTYSDNYIFNVPYMSTEFSAQTGTRGTAYSFSDFTLTNEQLTISTKEVVPIFIDRADQAQCTYVSQMEMAERQAALLLDKVESAVLADHAAWTDVGDVAGVITSGNTTQATVSATNIDDIVRGVRRIITVANGEELANRNGIFFVWRPADFEAKIYGLVKPFLINGETLRRKAKTTLNKQVSKITVQLQRLSEKALILREATV